MQRPPIPAITFDAASITTADTEASWLPGDDLARGSADDLQTGVETASDEGVSDIAQENGSFVVESTPSASVLEQFDAGVHQDTLQGHAAPSVESYQDDFGIIRHTPEQATELAQTPETARSQSDREAGTTGQPSGGRISRFFHRQRPPANLAAEPGSIGLANAVPALPSPALLPEKQSPRNFFKKRFSRTSSSDEPGLITTHSIITTGLPSSASYDADRLSPTDERPHRLSFGNSLSPTKENHGERSRSGSRSSASSLVADIAFHPSVAKRLSDIESTPESRALALLSLDPSLSTQPSPKLPMTPELRSRRTQSGISEYSTTSSFGTSDHDHSDGARRAAQRVQERADERGGVSSSRGLPIEAPHLYGQASAESSGSTLFHPSPRQRALLPAPDYDPLREPEDAVMQLAGRLHSSSRSNASFGKQKRSSIVMSSSSDAVGSVSSSGSKEKKRRPFSRLFSHGVNEGSAVATGLPGLASTSPPPSPRSADKAGEAELDPSLSLSTLLFGVLAEQRDYRPAKVMYGLALRSGWGVAKDEAQGLRWLRDAASEALAETNTEAVGSNEGARRGKEGKDEGNSNKAELQLAIYEVANSYAFGFGVAKDAAKALEYYEIAGTLGDIDSLNALGDAWYSGHPLPKGSKRNKHTAAQWYRHAESIGGQPILGNQWIWKDKYDVPGSSSGGGNVNKRD